VIFIGNRAGFPGDDNTFNPRNRLVASFPMAEDGALSLVNHGPNAGPFTGSTAGVTYDTDDPYGGIFEGCAVFSTVGTLGRSDGSGVFGAREGVDPSVPAGSFTWTGWLKLSAKTSGAILSYVSGGTFRYKLQYSAALDRFVWTLYNGGSVIATAVADELGAVSTGVWYFIEVYYDAPRLKAGIRVYTDRTEAQSLDVPLADEAALSAVWLSVAAPLRFGSTLVDPSVQGCFTHWNFWTRLLNVREETTFNQPTDWPWDFQVPQPPNLYGISRIAGVEIFALWDVPLDAGQAYDSWEVWRSINGSAFSLVATQPAVQTNYEEIFGAPDASKIGQIYSYKIRGVVGSVRTVYSQTLSYLITSALFAGTVTVAAPVGFFARPALADASQVPEDFVAAAGASVRLTWTDKTAGEYGHEIWRDDGNGYFKLIAVDAGVTEYEDAYALEAGDVLGTQDGDIIAIQDGTPIGIGATSQSTYKVRAVGFGDPSDFSDEVSQQSVIADQSGNPIGDQDGNLFAT